MKQEVVNFHLLEVDNILNVLKGILRHVSSVSSVDDLKKHLIKELYCYSEKIEQDKIIDLNIDNYHLSCPFIADVCIEDSVLVYFTNDDKPINRETRIIKSILNYSPFKFAINIDLKLLSKGGFKVLQRNRFHIPTLINA